MARYKINSNKSVTFLYISDKWLEIQVRETVPFTVSTNNINYLGVTPIKQVKDQYENFKSLKKEILEDLRRWKDLSCSCIGRVSIVKMATLPKTIDRFNTVSIKLPTPFFTDLKRTIFNFIWKSKKTKKSKMILNNKRIFWRYHYP